MAGISLSFKSEPFTLRQLKVLWPRIVRTTTRIIRFNVWCAYTTRGGVGVGDGCWGGGRGGRVDLADDGECQR